MPIPTPPRPVDPLRRTTTKWDRHYQRVHQIGSAPKPKEYGSEWNSGTKLNLPRGIRRIIGSHIVANPREAYKPSSVGFLAGFVDEFVTDDAVRAQPKGSSTEADTSLPS